MYIKRRAYLPCLAACGLVATLVGCNTTADRNIHQFEPLPVADVQTQELTPPPANQRAVTDILREAQENFDAANRAQETGDKEAALKHYTRMLELLSDANFDPAVFYNLRSEFKRILENGDVQANLTEPDPLQAGPDDIDDRLTGDIHIEFPLSERILTEIQEIQTLYPRNFQGGLDRSYKYLPYIRAEFAKAGLPTDLVWLAMVESQFSPKVVSRAGAGGMWQFMRSTGSRYGLKVNHYVDERFNWKKSTHAAIRYLRDLGERFGGEWPLAVTAYNMGEGGMERTIAAAGGEMNLWKLLDSSVGSARMQEETRKFYPKFVASMLVASNPEKFGFKANAQPAEQTVTIPVRGSYSLAALDKACGLPEGTLRQLNSDLVRGVTPPSDEFQLEVPPEVSERLITALREIPKSKSSEGLFAGRSSSSSSGRKLTHTVRRGETLSGIASKYGIEVASLMKANRMRSSQHLITGRKLSIPSDAPAPATVAESPTSEAKSYNTPQKSPNSVYTVKSGDTLYDIAQENKVSIKDLLAWNGKKSSKITAGEKLVLSPLEEMVEQTQQEQAAELTHIVKPGESPAKIAKRYGVGVDDFLAWNKLSPASTIKIGDKLVVRGAAEDAALQEVAKAEPETKPETTAKAAVAETASKQEPAAAPQVHVVAKGETLSTIAEKHGVGLSVLLRENNLTSKSVIRVGDKLKVPSVKLASAKSQASAPKAEEPAKQAPAPKSEPKVHIVARGDNPSTIASHYKVKVSELFKLNGWSKNVVLDVGDKVIVAQ